ncbi:adenosine deaminase [Hyphobacterium sp.]|uniref:adenosine deaminase n=1 Tax=Hyphobacterium sp. TaxID=2004662 RepID=UPI003BAA036B
MSDLHDLIQRLPKAELHLHLEGALEPEMIFHLAQRNQVAIPYESADDIRAAYQFTRLQDFLDLYQVGLQVLLTEQDFHDLTWDYLQRAHADNVRHVEIFIDPLSHVSRGVSFDVHMEGVLSALRKGQAELGISWCLILCYLRHLSEEEAFASLEHARPWLDDIAAVGLAAAEIGHPPSKFQRVFEASAALGLKRVAHAGEEGPAEYVREAMDLLKVDRIDHGNRALEDEDLTARLVEEQIPLTVCPLSNLRLCVVKDLKDHPIKRMLDLGLKANLNTDDPGYFGGHMNDNFIQTAEAVGLNADHIVTLVRNSFESSFLSKADITKHLAEIESISQVSALTS